MNKKESMNKKDFLYFILFFLLIASAPAFANAQGIDIPGILYRISLILDQIFIGLVIIMFVYAGIMYLIARGDPGKIQTANNALKWAIVGTAVGLLANLADNFVNYILFG